MTEHLDNVENLTSKLSRIFLQNYPADAARSLELMAEQNAVNLLVSLPAKVRENIWQEITPATAVRLITLFDETLAIALLGSLNAALCANLLSRLTKKQREFYLKLMNNELAEELRELLIYPENTAGFIMDSRVLAFDLNLKVVDVLGQLKNYASIMRNPIYILDRQKKLVGQIILQNLITAEPQQTLAEVNQPVIHFVQGLDLIEDVAEKLQQTNIERLAVVDVHHHILGIIRGASAIETLKQDISGDLQTMVGASRDEQALSSAFFAVGKRHGWLQINLLTCFLAATVVGMFEQTIAQFTALAVLMPIAAGQSGNTGAQALAVTMRGLTLREITTRNWLQVMLKEAAAGLLNGLGIAITCGAGVYVWSQSFGLALVIVCSMLISMTIAGTAGALVPIFLKKIGQDPAQSSSIILTTVTDIVGFMSFLGIATLLSSLLI